LQHERSSEHSVEDLYSKHATESGESSGSNYESTSSFEARKAKRAAKMRHDSATSKAAAVGRKQQMHIRCARALNKSPQSVYRKEKASASAAQKKNTHKKQQASSSESENKTQSSPSNSETESDESNKTSAPSRNKKASKGKQQKPTAEEKQAGTKPRKGVKLPHKVVNEDYEGSQEKGVPIVDSRPGKKKGQGLEGREERLEQEERKMTQTLVCRKQWMTLKSCLQHTHRSCQVLHRSVGSVLLNNKELRRILCSLKRC